MQQEYFVDVILPIPIEKQFTYRISEREYGFIRPGMRIAVPFGKSRIYTALACKLHQNAPEIYEAKEIHQILDEAPIVTEKQLQLWFWIASYYMCAPGEVFRAAVPGALLIESETIVLRNEEFSASETTLKDDEWLIYEALQHQPILKVTEISAILDKKNVLPVLKRLLEKDVIRVKEEIHEQYRPKLVRFVRVAPAYDSEEALRELLDTLGRAQKQKEVLMGLFSISASTKKPVKLKELQEKTGASAAVIKTLLDKKILEDYHIRTDRVEYSGNPVNETRELNEFQAKALSEIKEHFESGDVTLLYGITSSGKTEIYVKLIEEVLARGKQVLYLLPEIALTSQLIHRLQNYFGEQVSVYHSKYSNNERVEVWNNLLRNSPKTRIVLGARSSVFLPFSDLGLVIVDEEHEASFKQFDPAPRYHARDVAVVLAHMYGARVLLGSATPSVESSYNAKTGKYGLVGLTRRYGNVLLPEMELVDIKDKRKKKRMKGHFSDRLMEEIRDSLAEDEQVILFQNRRGYAPVMECNTCGHSPQCPSCDVSLTYHQTRKQLRCHYCGYHIALPLSCMACGSSELETKGFGTEQVEEELRSLFPDARTGRMDSDTTRGKYGYEKIITAFEQQEIDILVGTQMLTKGLDFRNVSLVGIMNADSLLNYPDFRAFERSFQLILQVAGRAGRTEKRGRVIIQTYNPYHQILQQASMNKYGDMFTDQLNDRKQFCYPPFYRLIKISLRHKNYNTVQEGSVWYAGALQNYFGAAGWKKEYILGPESPSVGRIRNHYIKDILIKIPQGQNLRAVKEGILRIHKSFGAIATYRSVRVAFDVDTY
ncbi:replication restart helicase PriA [Sinomicrobium weinanense]|uniref:Replication restart protein PriA n=1 Tax=Sinomicrobium weinanense TaxID=2842200 RepID=A0A926Q4E6_9FLAO|nr:primosomal protein N' [Sinomicrobium weinanense]MBC9797889.1 primosomal protein N' [Sinomicrobium weinanense]MBU3122763.1 primosomal protein N' [Sinomicrobium weinanense]